MTPAHHRPDGRFRNPWPGELPHEFKDFLRWRRARRARRASVQPKWSPRIAVSAFDRPRAAHNALTATWVGHASVLLQLGNLNVLTDPMWSDRASPVQWAGPKRVTAAPFSLDALPPIDIVLVSHNHYDHLDRGTVHQLAVRHPRAAWFCPLGVSDQLRAWGAEEVRALDWWDAGAVHDARVVCTPARHFSGRTPWDRWQSLWCGWVVESGAWRVFFAGDTAYHPEFSTIASRHGPLDLVLMPIGAYEPRWFMGSVHMDPADAIRAYADVCAAHPTWAAPAVLPIHWGTFRLTDEPLDEPPMVFRKLWSESERSPDDLWLLAHGETRRRGKPG